jgi:predicted nuclease with TOPRIM domain
MFTVETAPQQAEHFEWLSNIGFYTSYLDIITDRLDAIRMMDAESADRKKINELQDQLMLLRERLNKLSYAVSEHMDDVEIYSVTENRLDMELQSIHHNELRDNFEEFEHQLNAFRAIFNEYYVRLL